MGNHLPFSAAEIWTRNIIKIDPTPSHNLCSLFRIVKSTCNDSEKRKNYVDKNIRMNSK